MTPARSKIRPTGKFLDPLSFGGLTNDAPGQHQRCTGQDHAAAPWPRAGGNPRSTSTPPGGDVVNVVHAVVLRLHSSGTQGVGGDPRAT